MKFTWKELNPFPGPRCVVFLVKYVFNLKQNAANRTIEPSWEEAPCQYRHLPRYSLYLFLFFCLCLCLCHLCLCLCLWQSNLPEKKLHASINPPSLPPLPRQRSLHPLIGKSKLPAIFNQRLSTIVNDCQRFSKIVNKSSQNSQHLARPALSGVLPSHLPLPMATIWSTLSLAFERVSVGSFSLRSTTPQFEPPLYIPRPNRQGQVYRQTESWILNQTDF